VEESIEISKKNVTSCKKFQNALLEKPAVSDAAHFKKGDVMSLPQIVVTYI